MFVGQSGNTDFTFYCANSSGGPVTVPSSGWNCYMALNGVNQSTSSAVITQDLSDLNIYILNLNIGIGEGYVRIAKSGVTVTPSFDTFATTQYNSDSIYARFTQNASIPVANSSAAYGSWTACYSDDVILPITINIPSSLYGGSSSTLAGWTFTTYSAGNPSISGGSVSIVNPTAGLLTLTLLNAKLPLITGGASSISLVVEIHGLSPTALHLCVYRLNLTITS